MMPTVQEPVDSDIRGGSPPDSRWLASQPSAPGGSGSRRYIPIHGHSEVRPNGDRGGRATCSAASPCSTEPPRAEAHVASTHVGTGDLPLYFGPVIT